MKLYNTFTRQFNPIPSPDQPKDKEIGIYACGPTVYDDPHIGHARSVFVFDVLQRYLKSFKGLKVKYVRNVTDVDDKIIERARKEESSKDLKQACEFIAERYLASYHSAMKLFGVDEPDIEPKATEHVVPVMTDFISKLFMEGVAYEAKGDVYFSVRKFAGYGKLSNRSIDELQIGVRVEPGEQKQDPLDFALWKAAKPNEPSWNSPWGPGRPGWHIECSAMSTKYLGDEFEIHGGGLDLIFPHHENEIAQARATRRNFARLWIHHGLVTVNGEKMSKSSGNFVTMQEVFKQYPQPDYLKIFFLKTHYRSPIDYSADRMEEAKHNWQEFSRFFQHYYQRQADQASGVATMEIAQGLQRFEAAMDDDLNTPMALAALFDIVNAGHRMLESSDPKSYFAARGVYDVLVQCGRVLGLFQRGLAEESPETLAKIQALIVQRDAARKTKNFQRADEIRERLKQEGYFLADTAGGTLWRRAT